MSGEKNGQPIGSTKKQSESGRKPWRRPDFEHLDEQLHGSRRSQNQKNKSGELDDHDVKNAGRQTERSSSEKRQSTKGKRKERIMSDAFERSSYQADPTDRGLRGTFVPRWVMQITSSKAELLVLAQLAYWFGKNANGDIRAKIKRNGYFWVAKTFRKLGKEVHLSRGQVRAAIRKLREKGILVGDDNQQADEYVRYRLSARRIAHAVHEASSRDVGEEIDDE